MLSRNRLAYAATAFISLVWLGMLLGVSFLSTPARFQSSLIEVPVALDVGRITFQIFARVEWVWAVLLLAAAVPFRVSRWILAASLVVVALLAGEFFWLLPALSDRADMVIAGEPLPPGPYHFLYSSAEILKAALLLAIGLPSLLKLARRSSNSGEA